MLLEAGLHDTELVVWETPQPGVCHWLSRVSPPIPAWLRDKRLLSGARRARDLLNGRLSASLKVISSVERCWQTEYSVWTSRSSLKFSLSSKKDGGFTS